ncbi:hypothetical protein RE6C_00004 [Rhodopirellula europaea 6C]|uniref:Uncharacterized protein n=1 Tax=Rhodopirellula europaea 6C TaxID=1263867 RepID=M2AQ78_9BACT|nr:hypothetical protein RE6C_00004 [Rhodopirellula europaea 6C]
MQPFNRGRVFELVYEFGHRSGFGIIVSVTTIMTETTWAAAKLSRNSPEIAVTRAAAHF